jgi:protein-S-isoprenylcysteine O-methyltransferase Ste14
MLPTQLFDPGQPLNPELARSLILLLPVIALGIAFWIRPPAFHQRVGMMLGILWNIPYLLLFNIVAVEQGWWHFVASPNTFYSVPVELLLGWAFFWGALLPYACERTNVTVPILLALFIDMLVMPKLPMLFTLGEYWLFGEALLLLGCLLPSLLIYRLTVTGQAVRYRALLQSGIWGGWNVFLIPAMILSFVGKEFFSILALEGWRLTLFINIFLGGSFIGYAALHEFVQAGNGTPLPFDPPQSLVTTGPYAYVANPLQISMFLIFASLAIALGSGYMLMALVAVVIFSEAFVRWHHDVDAAERFGEEWLTYKRQVRNWFPRWTPYVHQPSTVYVSEACRICREMGTGLQSLKPAGITFTPATLHPSKDLERVTYRHYSGRFEESGVSAVARIFEQVNLSFAALGWLMRFPGINYILQIIIDGSGERGEKVVREQAD